MNNSIGKERYKLKARRSLSSLKKIDGTNTKTTESTKTTITKTSTTKTTTIKI